VVAVPSALEHIDGSIAARVASADGGPLSPETTVAALDQATAVLGELTAEVESLLVRVFPLAQRERRVSERERSIARERAELTATAEQQRLDELDLQRRLHEIDRREREHGEALVQHAQAVDAVRRVQDRLDKLAIDVSREHVVSASVLQRVRSAWDRRREAGSSSAEPCDLLFLPTPEGYTLLRQEGLALRRGARLTLAVDGPTFVVTKISRWPFDDRCCAYLQQEP
jgi:chromosome segregation ATPase